jgi:hypothetical protein
MKQRVLKYYTGETVWTLNGIDWFITNLRDETLPISKPNVNAVALDMTETA